MNKKVKDFMDLNVTVAHTGNNYCAMIDGVDSIMVSGNSIDEIKTNQVSAIEDTKTVCKGIRDTCSRSFV